MPDTPAFTVGPPVLPVPGAQQTPVMAAIAHAAAATGVDFHFLLAQARLESGLDPDARARTSTARGLYQFTGSSWLRMLDRHGADLGLDVTGGAAKDPAMRAQLLALRSDPDMSARMAGDLANDNRDYLTTALGRDPDNAELYLAHFLGPDAATRFLSALQADPTQSAAALLPRPAAANHAIFFDGDTPRSVGDVMALLRARLDAAMGAGSGLPVPANTAFAAQGVQTAPPAPAPTGGPLAQEFAAVSTRGSMADTLKLAFGLSDGGAGDGAVPGHVRAAYGQMRALGL